MSQALVSGSWWAARRALAAVTISVLGTVMSLASASQLSEPRPAVPLDAFTAILDAFDTYPVVALGEGPHGNEQGYAFRLALVRNPRFATLVNDIVVECGNGRYQSRLDQFIAGEDLPESQVREMLLDSAIETSSCERPVYGDFLRAVRELNQTLPSERRLRVLFGAPPLIWEKTRTRAEYLRQALRRDRWVADLVRHESLLNNRRVLIIYGDGHFQARRERPPRSILAHLDAAGIKVLAISNVFADFASIQSDVALWPTPSFAWIRGTPIGARAFTWFYGPNPPGVTWPVAFEDHFDAILYLGPPSARTTSRLPAALCKDDQYMRERFRRLSFAPPVARQDYIDAMKRFCAAHKNSSVNPRPAKR
jgi:hypothetical protein